MPGKLSRHPGTKGARNHACAHLDAGHETLPEGELFDSDYLCTQSSAHQPRVRDVTHLPLMVIIERRVMPEDPRPRANLEHRSCQKEVLIPLGPPLVSRDLAGK